MRETYLKQLFRRALFPPNSIRRILLGPLRGLRFRTNEITNIAPIVSGYERDNQRIFQQHIKPGDVVFDIGACWGIHTLLFSKLVGQSGKVFCFEPDPDNFAELQFHLQLNQVQNAHCFPYALADSNGEATFHRAHHASMGSLIKQAGREGEAITVAVHALDKLIAEIEIDRLDFMKLDIEGAEVAALTGAKHLIAKYRPKILIDKNSDEDISQARQWLEALRYTCVSYPGSLLALS